MSNKAQLGPVETTPFAVVGYRAWLALAIFALVEFVALQSEQAFSYGSGSEAELLGLTQLPVILPAAAVLVAALLMAPARLRVPVLGLGLVTVLLHRALLHPETLYLDAQEIFDRAFVALLLIGLIVPPLVRRFLGPTPQFSRVRTIIGFALLSALGLVLCETVVVFAVHAQHPEIAILPAWVLWLRANLLGLVLIVPAAVLCNEWRRSSFEGMNHRRWQELAVLCALLVFFRAVLGVTIFAPFFDVAFILWALYRFPQAVPMTTVLLFVLTESALISDPFGFVDPQQPRYAQLVSIQGVMLVSVLAVQLISAGIEEWRAGFVLLRESQERLRMALEAARDGIYEWKLKTGEFSIEPALAEVFGEGVATTTPHVMSAVMPQLHPEDVPHWWDYRIRMDDPGGRQEVEFRVKSLAGEWIWFRVRGAAVDFDDEGRAERAVGVFEDVTERKAAEQALRESEHQSRTMSTLSSEGICKLSASKPIPTDLSEEKMIEFLIREMRIEDCNEVNAHMYGYESPAAMAGVRFKEFTPEDQLNSDCIQRFVRDGFGRTEGEVRNIRRDGKEIYCIVNVIGIVEDGELQSVWRFARDITERKQAELRLAEANLKLHQIIAQAQEFSGIIGDSPSMMTVREGIEKVALSDFTVLILGETGTGKELIAQAIHSRSRRKDRPLVRLNCAVLTPSLIESELFGYEKGAFTGASALKIGRFELADGGTILLDEIGELPLESQAKLLRVMQEGEFERVGGTRTHRVDVRVLAATNRDLKASVESGSFRADLYYRLHVFPLRLPPLRERGDDVIALANHFLAEASRNLGRSLTGFSGPSLQMMYAYRWPGNVRELQHAVERAAILSNGPIVEMDDFIHAEADAAGPLRTLAEAERDHIRKVLELTSWIIEGPNGAAAVLGVAASTLRNRLAKLGVKRPKYKQAAAASKTSG